MKKTNYETKILSRNRNSAESGRSMVEMLGVLAIVGVISIGGIAGYNYGMNRYRTNELLDGANKRAYTVATQITLGIPINLSEFKEYDATAGGTFQTAVQEWQDDGEFGIQVTGVKKEVCENILRMIGDNTPLRALSKGEVGSEEELQECEDRDTNAFSFVYNVEMLSKGAQPSSHSGVSSTGGSASASSSGPTTCTNDDDCGGYPYYCMMDNGICECAGERCPDGRCVTDYTACCPVCEGDAYCDYGDYVCVCNNGAEYPGCVLTCNSTDPTSSEICCTTLKDGNFMCGEETPNGRECICADKTSSATCGVGKCIECPAGTGTADCEEIGYPTGEFDDETGSETYYFVTICECRK